MTLKPTNKQLETARMLFANPAALGRAIGYKDLRDDLHGEWMRMMLDINAPDMTLQAHRGSYKTTCLCVAIAIMLVRYRDKNIIFLRKTDNDVTEVIKNVYRIIQHPVFVSAVSALTGASIAVLRATATEITTSLYCAPRGASQLLGIGIGGSITGKHADIVITDDIVNVRDRESRAERKRTIAAYMELQNIRNRGGRIINTGTPWHVDDAFTVMPTPLRFDCYQTGLISKEKIEELRRSMAASLFSANYEMRHIAAENALFGDAPTFGGCEADLRDGIAHVDAAYGGEDYTSFTCAKRRGDTIYAYGKLWHSHVDTCMDAIVTEARKMMCEPIYCETNGDKGYLGREIQRRGVYVYGYHERMNKYAKIASFLRKWWTHIVWLEGTDREYIQQIQNYTADAEHDDAPDSAASIIRILDGSE